MAPPCRPWVSNWKALYTLLGLVGISLLQGCARSAPDIDRVRAIVEDAARAAEAKDIAAIQKHVARDYRDPQGNDYQGLRELLFFHFRQAETVRVFLRRTEVTVDGDEAHVTARVILARGRKVEHPKDLLPEAADAYLFRIRFSKRDGAWLAVSAQWEPIGLEGVL